MADPKCPSCDIEGIDHIVSGSSKEEDTDGNEWFNVVYCDNCGYVYGVFTKYLTVYQTPTPPVVIN